MDEFAASDYRVASLDRIAASGGVSKGSLYHYFEGKLDMYRWLMTEELPRRKLAALGIEAASTGSLFERLEQAFHAGLALFVREPRLARLASRLAGPASDPELQDLHRESAEATHAYLVRLVRQAQQEGEVREELAPDLVASIIASIMGRGLVDALMRQLGTDIDGFGGDPSVVEEVAPAVIDGLVADAADVLRRAIGT